MSSEHDQAIAAWLQALPENVRNEATGSVGLAAGYGRRTARLTAMITQLTLRRHTSKGRAGVGINEIKNYDVALCANTTNQLSNGIKRALANFVNLLVDMLSSSVKCNVRRDAVVRLDNTRLAAAEELWAAIDDGAVDAQSVYSRAVVVVDKLWQEHAVKAVHAEREHIRMAQSQLICLCEFCNRTKRLNASSHELVNPPKASRQVLAAIEAVLSEPRLQLKCDNASSGVEAWLISHANELHGIFLAEANRLGALLLLDTHHPAWSSIEVREGTDLRAVQGPSTHAPIMTSSGGRVVLASTRQTEAVIPTVRLCYVLRVLVHRKWLRLHELDSTYLLKLVQADLTRLESAIECIVERDLTPLSVRAAAPFCREWLRFSPVQLLVFPEIVSVQSDDACIPDTPVSCEVPDWIVADVSLQKRLTDEDGVFSNLSTRLRTVPNDLEFDYTTLSVLMVALNGCSSRSHTICMSPATLATRVATMLPPSSRPVSNNGVLQKVAATFKQLATNCAGQGMRCAYLKKDGARCRELVLEQTHAGVSVIHATCLIITQILRGMEANGIWPRGVHWKRASRHRMRNRGNKPKHVESSVANE